MTNQLIIICVYRAPSGDFHQFLRLLDLILLSLYKPKTEFVICGDINVDYLSDSDRKLQLSQLLGTYNMIHTVNFPTRFQSSCRSAIDNIFINDSQFHSCSILPIYNGLSDHDAQCLILKTSFAKKKIMSGKFKTRLITTDTINYFQELLLKETWEEIYREHDINETYNAFLKTYLTIFET